MFTKPKPTPQRWVKVAVDFYRNPKIIKSGIYAELAYLRLLAMARERVETATADGEIPQALAERELRDIADAAGMQPDGLLHILQDNQLITIEDETITVDDYARWQTTRDEIESRRNAARDRAAARRKKTASVTAATTSDSGTRNQGRSRRTPGAGGHSHTTPASSDDQADDTTAPGTTKENDMGLYDTPAAPFDDLRATIEIPSKAANQHSLTTLDPAYADRVETVAQHILEVRKQVLGAGQRSRIGSTWRKKIQNLLKGETAAGMSFTPEQLCDLFDFAAQHHFWRGPVNEPEGLIRHAHKIWASGDFVAWSINHDRPKENRPSGIKPSHPKKQADIQEDWTDVEWDN